MSSDCEKDDSFDSLPSMASERSTHISTMRLPYALNPKLFDREESFEDSPIKDYIEKRGKPLNPHFSKLPNYKPKKLSSRIEMEGTFEMDRLDPFLQPTTIKDSQPRMKKIQGIKTSDPSDSF